MHNKAPALLALLLCASFACYEPSTSPTPEVVIETFDFQGRNAIEVRGDGFSRLTVVARVIASNVSEGSVIFRTTRGYLLGEASESEVREVEVPLDGSGAAYAELVSPRDVGDAELTARLKGTVTIGRLRVRFTEANPDSILLFELGIDTADADGFSLTPVIVRAASGLPADVRHVSFTTTVGDFAAGAGDEAAATATAVIGADRRAVVEVRSPVASGAATITATLAGYAQQRRLVFRSVSPDDIVRFTSDAVVADADGATKTWVVIAVSPRLPTALRVARFETTAGRFVTGAVDGGSSAIEVPVDLGNTARIELKSPEAVAEGRVTVRVGSFTQELPIRFVEARPDTILVDPGAFTVSAGGQLAVTAKLLRRAGQVTRNTLIRFEAFGVGGSPVGQFRNATPSDANGVATAQFSAAGLEPGQRVAIWATLLDGSRSGVAYVTVAP